MTEKKSKVCSKCKQEKSLCDFHKDAIKKLGVTSQCKKCQKERYEKCRQENPEKIKESVKKYYQKNKEKIKEHRRKYYQKNSEKIKEREAKYRRENSEKIKEREAKYRQENSEKVKERVKKYRRENPEKIRVYLNKRYKNDENFRMIAILRARLRKSLNSQSSKKSKRTLELVGCSIRDIRQHLENQFKDGMSWENQGEWHIDHIKPCPLFDLTDPEQQKECFNYKNLQPLWAIDNIKKSNKWQAPEALPSF